MELSEDVVGRLRNQLNLSIADLREKVDEIRDLSYLVGDGCLLVDKHSLAPAERRMILDGLVLLSREANNKASNLYLSLQELESP